MTNDDLRALADKLRHAATIQRHYCKAPQALAWADDLDSAADHLRAQADAQPVAWMHPDGRVVPAATMDQAYMDGGASWSSLRDYMIPLYRRVTI